MYERATITAIRRQQMATKKKILDGVATVCHGEIPPVTSESIPKEPVEIKHVRVCKKVNDGMSQFCGERVQTDPDGKEFFNLTIAAKESVDRHPNLIWPAE
jgi:hypothetical protein